MKFNKLSSKLLAKFLLISTNVSCFSCCVSAMELTREGKIRENLEHIILDILSKKCERFNDLISDLRSGSKSVGSIVTIDKKIGIESLTPLLKSLSGLLYEYRKSESDSYLGYIIDELRSYIQSNNVDPTIRIIINDAKLANENISYIYKENSEIKNQFSCIDLLVTNYAETLLKYGFSVDSILSIITTQNSQP